MNRKITVISAILGGVLLTSTSAMAQVDMLSGWSGSASLGALWTSGNSETTNVNGSASVSKQIDLWKHTAFGNTYTAESNEVETANRFELGYQLDRNFNETLYGFGRLRFDTDDYGNLDSRFSGIVGVGNTFINDGQQTLSAELGIGAHKTDYIVPLNQWEQALEDGEVDLVTGLPVITVAAADDDRISDDGAVLYGGVSYSNNFRENLTFHSNLNFEAAESNTLTLWDNSLNISLSDSIGLSLGLLIRNNTDIVGAGNENTDTATRASIVVAL